MKKERNREKNPAPPSHEHALQQLLFLELGHVPLFIVPFNTTILPIL